MTNEEAIKNIVAYFYFNNDNIPEEVIKAVDIAILALKEKQDRPQGEWIRTGSLGNGNAQYKCSNCHHGDEHAESQEVPYCWHCGAKMKKGGKE